MVHPLLVVICSQEQPFVNDLGFHGGIGVDEQVEGSRGKELTRIVVKGMVLHHMLFLHKEKSCEYL